MQRSTLQPLRTRRMFVSVTTTPSTPAPAASPTAATRRTLGALGAIWVSFAASATGERRLTKLPRPARAGISVA